MGIGETNGLIKVGSGFPLYGTHGSNGEGGNPTIVANLGQLQLVCLNLHYLSQIKVKSFWKDMTVLSSIFENMIKDYRQPIKAKYQQNENKIINICIIWGCG